MLPAGLQLSQEELTVEVQELLQVPEDDRAFPPQVLREVDPVHLRKVVMDDVAQRADVLPLSGDHLLHDVTQFTAETQGGCIVNTFMSPVSFPKLLPPRPSAAQSSRLKLYLLTFTIIEYETMNL